MAVFKATLVMTIWSVAVGYGLWSMGVQHHIPSGYMWGAEPMWMSLLWSLGTAVGLVVAIMVNVMIFSSIAGAGNRAWKWFK